MGPTVREKKQVSAEVYLEQDGEDVDIHIVTPNGTDVVIAWFDGDGQFMLAYPDGEEVSALTGVVKLNVNNVLSVEE